MSKDPIKEVLNLLPYGFYAITTTDGQEDVNIMVANWLTQVAFTPRLVALGLQKTSYSYGLVQKGRVFAVNVFHKADADVLKAFTKSRARNPDKVKAATFTLSPTVKCPVIEAAAAYLECSLVRVVDVNADHDVVIGEVIGAQVLKPGDVGDTLTLPDLGWSYAG